MSTSDAPVPGSEVTGQESTTKAEADTSNGSHPPGVTGDSAGQNDSAVAWRTSTARQRAQLEYFVTGAVAALIFGGGYLLVLLSLTSYEISRHDKDERLGFGIGLAVFGLALVIAAITRLTRARIRYQEAEEARSRKAVGTAIEELRYDTSFPSLLKVNQTQMDQYHDITKHQAENAYRNSQIAMGSGLIILVAAAIAAIILKNNTSKIVLGGVAGIGTAFSAYIGATFLNAYHSALAQLNFYFRQPLINSYLLSAERLASDMSADRRDDVRAQIVESMLTSAIADIRLYSDETSLRTHRTGLPLSGRRSRISSSDQ
jgi:hypothetical protein